MDPKEGLQGIVRGKKSCPFRKLNTGRVRRQSLYRLNHRGFSQKGIKGSYIS
jgi:ribosome modulation factor